jgi:deoxyadenosine/deoxycytidine kinase
MQSECRIEICGGIASGKTTLAKLLANGTPCTLVLENFRENPFWAKFYAHPEVYRHEKDITFLAQHCGDLKLLARSLTVCDYAVLQDIAYARLSNDRRHPEVMKSVAAHLYAALPAARLIVYLQCDEDVLLKRIRDRGRAEETPITRQYLAELNRHIDDMIESCAVPVFRVHSDEIDFVSDPAAQKRLSREILDFATDLQDRSNRSTS